MKRIIALLVTALSVLFMLSGCGRTSSNNGGSSAENTVTYVSPSSLEAERVEAEEPASDHAVKVKLIGSTAEIDGSGASFSDGVITITEGGVYSIEGTLDDGRILINAPKADVSLVFNSVSITCSYGSPVYVYKAREALIYLPDGTASSLADGSGYSFADGYSSSEDDEPNACLYSKADLVIAGRGSLNVSANYKNGITSKDTLRISGCTLEVSAKNHGINGKDKNIISDADITVKAVSGDGIRSTNDSDPGLGCVSVLDSSIKIECGKDGIQAVTSLVISGGKTTVASGGGCEAAAGSDSAKGIKSDGALLIDGGVYDLDCLDDAVHSNGDALIKSGTFTVSTADDAFHADKNLSFTGGEITVNTCKEGYEGLTVTVSGGTHAIMATDDGINASEGKSSTGGNGRDEFKNNENCRITVEGGRITIMAGGDGVDSNGLIVMTGGSLIVSSTGNADGALDFNGTMTVSGGYLLAFTGGGMPEAPGTASQPVIAMGFGSNQPKGSEVMIKTESGEITFELPINANHVVFSSPELRSGESVTVSCSGSEIGTAVLTDGTLSVGTVGNFGPGGNGGPGGPGGQGGFPGRPGGPGGQGAPDGTPPVPPGGNTPPESGGR